MVLSIVAGLAYNSWPLGYWLNPPVAHRGLASELEGLHQPYNWVFVSCDVVSSLLIALVALLIWRRVRGRAGPSRWLLQAALWNVAGFSLFTILDALLPLRCDPSVRRCPSFTHDPLLLFHGIFSITASLLLFFSVVLIWWLDRRDWVLHAILWGYVLFSVFSLISVLTPGQDSWAQHYYLTLCSLWLAVLPYCVWQALASGPASADVSAPKHHVR